MSGDKRGLHVGAIAVGLGVAAAALALVLFATRDPDRPIDEDEESPLPTPGPLEERPLVPPGRGGVGWSFVSPLPRAMPTWNDVSVASDGRVAIVGVRGQSIRIDDGGVWLVPTQLDVDLRGVAWLDGAEAIAVGDGGVIRVLGRPGVMREIESGTDVMLRDVVVGDGVAWVVGDDGTLLSVENGRVTRVDTGTDRDLLAVFVRDGVVVAVGEGGTIVRVESGRASLEPSGTTFTLRGVGGCRRRDLYAVGDEGRVLRRTSEGWRGLAQPLAHPFAALGCAFGRVVATTMRGGVLLVSGNDSVVLESGTDRALRSVSGGARAGFIVGDSGRLFRVERDHLRSLTAGPTSPLRDLRTIGGALVAVGEWGRIFRQRERGFEAADSPTDAALAGLATIADGELVAVGDLGAVLHIDFERAELVESPSDTSWRDVVTGGGSLLAVGTSGGVLRGRLDALSEMRMADTGDLWAVAGSPSNAIAVGDGGIALRITPERSVRIRCPYDDGLRGVVTSEAGTWAVGLRGLVVRIEGESCTVERSPSDGADTLNGIGLGPSGAPLAVGAHGTALERTPSAEWAPVDLGAGDIDLRTVVRDARDVYVVGASGAVLRHVLLDGT